MQEFLTTQNGFRLATSVGGVLTGRGLVKSEWLRSYVPGEEPAQFDMTIQSVQQLLSFAVFVTLRIVGVGFHRASLSDAGCEHKSLGLFPGDNNPVGTGLASAYGSVSVCAKPYGLLPWGSLGSPSVGAASFLGGFTLPRFKALPMVVIFPSAMSFARLEIRGARS